MATVDASIPLSYQAPQLITPAQLLSLKDLQVQSQMRQAQLAALPEQQAQERQQHAATMAELQARTQSYKTLAEEREQKRIEELQTKRVQYSRDSTAGAVDAYDRTIATGADQATAKQRALEVTKQKIDEAESSGLFTPEQIKQIRAKAADFNPDMARSSLTTAESWLKQREAQTKAGIKPAESSVGKAEDDFKAGRITKAEKDALVRKETHIAEPVGASGKASISEAAIDQAARTYLTDGKLPTNLGRGMQGANNVSAILNRAAEIDPNANIAASGAGYKADTASLTALTKQYDAVTSFEKTAIRNGDRLLALADKADTTGVPALERWIRAGRQATGSPDVATFHAQMLVYRNEAAKILTNPNLSGQLTDASRREVTEFLSGNASAPQIRAVVGLLKNDFENRKKTLEEQINDVKGRLTSEGKSEDKGGAPKAAEPKAAEQAAPVRISGDTEYNALPSGTLFIGPDGKRRTKP